MCRTLRMISGTDVFVRNGLNANAHLQEKWSKCDGAFCKKNALNAAARFVRKIV